MRRRLTRRDLPRPNLQAAIIGGLAATSVMTPVAYLSPAFQLQQLDFASLLGSLVTSQTTPPVSAAWLLGMFLHFVNGSLIFPAIYAFVLYRLLPGPPWIKGTVFGIVLWVLAQTFVMPLAGLGLFSSQAIRPVAALAWSLGTHLLYGVVLGAVAAPWLRRSIEQDEREARAA